MSNCEMLAAAELIRLQEQKRCIDIARAHYKNYANINSLVAIGHRLAARTIIDEILKEGDNDL